MADSRLMEGEEVVFQTNKHWMAPVADSWKAVLFILGSVVLAWLQPEQTDGIIGFVGRLIELLKLGLLFVGIGWIIYNVIAWRSAEYAVTNLRILGSDGLARKRTTDTLLTSVSDVRSRVTAIGKAMGGYGNIQIFTSSGEAGSDTFTTVREVEPFKRAILEQKTKAPAPAAPSAAAPAAAAPAAPPPPDAMATLNNLAQMRDNGVITPEEFETKKQELLTRI